MPRGRPMSGPHGGPSDLLPGSVMSGVPYRIVPRPCCFARDGRFAGVRSGRLWRMGGMRGAICGGRVGVWQASGHWFARDGRFGRLLSGRLWRMGGMRGVMWRSGPWFGRRQEIVSAGMAALGGCVAAVCGEWVIAQV